MIPRTATTLTRPVTHGMVPATGTITTRSSSHILTQQHRHETIDGYPIFEVIRTDHAFTDSKVRFDLAVAGNTDGGEADETEFSGEFFWSINNRLAVVVETPLIELNGTTTLNGDGEGSTVIDLTPGVRWAINHDDHAGIGISFPITGERESDWQVIFSFIHHFK